MPADLVIAVQVDDYILEREPSLVTESTQHVPERVARLGGHQAACAIREVHIAVLFHLPRSTSRKQISIPESGSPILDINIEKKTKQSKIMKNI